MAAFKQPKPPGERPGWSGCACPSCARLNALHPDGGCARCGAGLPGASQDDMDVCTACDYELSMNLGPDALPGKVGSP